MSLRAVKSPLAPKITIEHGATALCGWPSRQVPVSARLTDWFIANHRQGTREFQLHSPCYSPFVNLGSHSSPPRYGNSRDEKAYNKHTRRNTSANHLKNLIP